MKKILAALGIIIFLLILLRINLVNELEVPDAQEYDYLQGQILYYHNQNLELEDRLLYLESYTYIEEEAKKKGYRPGTIIYLSP